MTKVKILITFDVLFGDQVQMSFQYFTTLAPFVPFLLLVIKSVPKKCQKLCPTKGVQKRCPKKSPKKVSKKGAQKRCPKKVSKKGVPSTNLFSMLC